MKYKVLIGSAIRQKPSILRLFLTSLLQLETDSAERQYLFIDDNVEAESRDVLQQFHELLPGQVTIVPAETYAGDYLCDESTHHWNHQLIWKVADFKNRIIEHTLEQAVDALFLIDSDLLLHPKTLEKLIEAGKSVISEIFWTSWQPQTIPLPQVWISDQYTMYEHNSLVALTSEEQIIKKHSFLGQLRIPGVYEVGGLGACTLIRRDALEKGLNFNKIKYLSFWGEDRHFCVRAHVLGIPLHVDTHYPAFHIYRSSDLPEAQEWLLRYRKQGDNWPLLPQDKAAAVYPFPAIAKPLPKITLSMVVRNEAEKFLGLVLAKHREYIDEAVIIDDGSTDHSVEICRALLSGIPLHLVRNDTPRFRNEVLLRKQQWEETLRRNPEWILNMDADEMFDGDFASEVSAVLYQAKGDVGCFRLYDMWSDTQYRDDAYWQAHKVYRPLLLRYRPEFAYRWKEQPLHCGRFPENIFEQSHFMLPIRVKHLGWSTPEIRANKYLRYKELDPEGRYGWLEQYESILDPAPNLVPF